MKVSASVYAKGHVGRLEAYSSAELVAPEDIDQYLDDLKDYLYDTLEYLEEVVE